MQAISPLKLADDIDKGRHLTPNQVSGDLLDKHIDRLRAIDEWNDDALEPTKLLARLVHRNIRKLVTPETQAQLARSEVFVVPVPFCGAFSEGPQTIVIGSGFLDFLTANLYWGAVTHLLPENLSEIRHPKFPNESIRDLIPVLLLALLHLYLENGDPLPNYRALLGQNLDEQVQDSLAGSLTFVLLHELGHLILGHHGKYDQNIRFTDLPFQIPEDFSTYKTQEFEADNFARQAMVEDYRAIHMFWLRGALGPHFAMETMLSHRSETHPISINRLVHAQYTARDKVDRAAYLDELEFLTKQYQSLEAKNATLRNQGKLAALERFTRDDLLDLLSELDTYLDGPVANLQLAITSEMPEWHTIFSEPSTD
tara:strand:- start:239 stop:1345 length:1107 start_codon:yes stop_codon:yes gene_type:complete